MTAQDAKNSRLLVLNSQVVREMTVEVQAFAQLGFEAKMKQVNSDLSRLINKKIDGMFQEMAGVGVSAQDRVMRLKNDTSLQVVGQREMRIKGIDNLFLWPLKDSYIKAKGNDLFFKKTGDLINNVFAKGGKSVHLMVGGYSNKSVTAHKYSDSERESKSRWDDFTPQQIANAKAQVRRQGKNQKFQHQFRFNIFNKLARRAVPETIFDSGGYRLDHVPQRKGQPIAEPIALKLGVYKKKKLRYHRSIIQPYAWHYVNKVIPKFVAAYLNRVK